MNMEQQAHSADTHGILERISQDARSERLEFALPLIEAMRVSFALDRTMGDAPPGTLTVQGWMGLLKRWERILEEMPPRRIHFTNDFLQEVLYQGGLDQHPMGAVVRELVEMMEPHRDAQPRRAA